MTSSRFSRVVLAAVVAVAGMAVAFEQAQADTPSIYRYHRLRSFSTLGVKVLQFANGQMGKQVGNGECWTLAHDALAAAGARRPGQELGVYVFGTAVSLQDAKAGDILQFENVKFVSPNGARQMFGHHTAIVTSRSGNTIQIIHQNVNGQRTVQNGSINLAERQGGSLLAYRPQPR